MDQKSNQDSFLLSCISHVLSFLLNLLLVATSLVLILNLTILNEDFLRKQIDKSSFVSNITNELLTQFNSYGVSAGFDEEFFQSAIPLSYIEADIYREVSRIYSDTDKHIDYQAFRDKLYNSFIENAKSRGYEITEKENTGILYLTDLCTSTYINKLQIPYSEQLSNVLNKVDKIFNIIIFVLIILVIVLAIFILLINKSKRKKTRYFMYSLAAAFLMISVPLIFLYLSDIFERISIGSKSLYTLFQTYIQSTLSLSVFFAFLMLLFWLFIFTYRRVVLYGGKVYK